jgi:hypothetical protein
MGLKPPLQIISREAAHGMGLRRYYTGVACKKGHMCERYVSNTGCVECCNTSFKFKRNAFSHELVPFASSRIWTAASLSLENRQELEQYLQTCIREFLKHKALLTQDLDDAFKLQIEALQNER